MDGTSSRALHCLLCAEGEGAKGEHIYIYIWLVGSVTSLAGWSESGQTIWRVKTERFG